MQYSVFLQKKKVVRSVQYCEGRYCSPCFKKREIKFGFMCADTSCSIIFAEINRRVLHIVRITDEAKVR